MIVKGKTQPVSVYECLDYHDEASFPNLMDTLGAFNEGLQRYREADFAKALGWFEQALEANPGDKLAGIYVERCRTMLDEPVPSEWDGVWVMSEK